MRAILRSRPLLRAILRSRPLLPEAAESSSTPSSSPVRCRSSHRRASKMGKRKEAWMEDGRRKQRRSTRLLERGRDRAGDTSDRNPRRCKVADHPPRRCKVADHPPRRCEVSKATFVAACPLRHCRISAVSRIRKWDFQKKLVILRNGDTMVERNLCVRCMPDFDPNHLNDQVCYRQLTMDHPFEGGEVPNISEAVDESGEEERCSDELNVTNPQNTAGLWVPDDSTRRCSFFRWLDEGSQSTGYDQVHIDSESEVLPCKNQEIGAQSNLNTDKHGEIAGDIGDLLQCMSMMNHEIRHLKKEVRFLKEADRRRELDASAIKRNQVLMVVFICAILAHYPTRDELLKRRKKHAVGPDDQPFGNGQGELTHEEAACEAIAMKFHKLTLQLS
ncbi:hypothetical protein ACLOJK_038442 [Asimina triloba]